MISEILTTHRIADATGAVTITGLSLLVRERPGMKAVRRT
jgi:hypothetical protein